MASIFWNDKYVTQPGKISVIGDKPGKTNQFFLVKNAKAIGILNCLLYNFQGPLKAPISLGGKKGMDCFDI